MDNEKSIKLISTLIEVNNDRIAGYESALNETDEGDFKSLFTQFIATSKRCNHELLAEVHKLGDTLVADSNAVNLFFIVEDLPFIYRNRSILNSCITLEEGVADAYKNILNNHENDLSREQLLMITTQHELIKSEHDQIKNRRDTLKDS